jgi:DNA invertase Pin-like site-specific DNA recombinase
MPLDGSYPQRRSSAPTATSSSGGRGGSSPHTNERSDGKRGRTEACEEYCEHQGFNVPARFREEGESAKTADRTELQNVLQYCRANKGRVEFVVVFNLTRFAREKYDQFALCAHLKSLGISLRSATEPIDDTSTGKLMEGVLAAFAQFDNDLRSDRTRGGMRAALERGRWTFLAPLGYMNAPRSMGRSLMFDPERAPLVRQAFHDCESANLQCMWASRAESIASIGGSGRLNFTASRCERISRIAKCAVRSWSDDSGHATPDADEMFLAGPERLGSPSPCSK